MWFGAVVKGVAARDTAGVDLEKSGLAEGLSCRFGSLDMTSRQRDSCGGGVKQRIDGVRFAVGPD